MSEARGNLRLILRLQTMENIDSAAEHRCIHENLFVTDFRLILMVCIYFLLENMWGWFLLILRSLSLVRFFAVNFWFFWKYSSSTADVNFLIHVCNLMLVNSFSSCRKVKTTLLNLEGRKNFISLLRNSPWSFGITPLVGCVAKIPHKSLLPRWKLFKGPLRLRNFGFRWL